MYPDMDIYPDADKIKLLNLYDKIAQNKTRITIIKTKLNS